jgi:hypothetical protein
MLELSNCVVCNLPTNTRVTHLRGLTGSVNTPIGWLLCSPSCAYTLKTKLGLQNTPPRRLEPAH